MRRRIRGVTVASVVVGLALVEMVSEAPAATLFVANHGVDGPACGTVASPCRTIGFAVAGAAGGDEIVVGPGRYGDVDANGAIAGPAEEKAPDRRQAPDDPLEPRGGDDGLRRRQLGSVARK